MCYVLNVIKCCQIEFVKCYALCGGGRCYYNIHNDYNIKISMKVSLFRYFDIENVFSYKNDSEVVF